MWPEAHWPKDKFGVAIWTVATSTLVRMHSQTASSVLSLLNSSGPLYLEIHADTEKAALSDFIMWLNDGGMAQIRIDEHCEHYAHDPARSKMEGEIEGFPDGDGGWFSVLASSVVTRAEATEAIKTWLQGGSRWIGLLWD